MQSALAAAFMQAEEAMHDWQERWNLDRTVPSHVKRMRTRVLISWSTAVSV